MCSSFQHDVDLSTMEWVPSKQRPDWNKFIEAELAESFASKMMTNSSPCRVKFEDKVCHFLKIPDTHAVVAVCNATIGLHAAALAIDMQRGKKVRRYATQAWTFPASVQGTFAERTSIVDVTKDGELDLKQAESLDCDGLVVTNIFGAAGNIGQYCMWLHADPNRVLIFDNAAAPLTTDSQGRNLCSLATASVVSFHHTKLIGFGEGGVVIIEKEYEWVLRRAINFGFDTELAMPWNPMATNGKMSDVSAAFLLMRLKQIEDENIIAHVCDLHHIFKDGLRGSKRFSLLLGEQADKHQITVVPTALCVIAETVNLALQARTALKDSGCTCVRQYYRPLDDLANTNYFFARILCIPCHEEVSSEQALKVVGVLNNIGLSH